MNSLQQAIDARLSKRSNFSSENKHSISNKGLLTFNQIKNKHKLDNYSSANFKRHINLKSRGSDFVLKSYDKSNSQNFNNTNTNPSKSSYGLNKQSQDSKKFISVSQRNLNEYSKKINQGTDNRFWRRKLFHRKSKTHFIGGESYQRALEVIENTQIKNKAEMDDTVQPLSSQNFVKKKISSLTIPTRNSTSHKVISTIKEQS